MSDEIIKMLVPVDNPLDMFNKIKEMSRALEVYRTPGSAGGGLVKIQLNGKHEFVECKIDPTIAGDVELIEDLIIAAVADAVKGINEKVELGYQKLAAPGSKEQCNCPVCRAARELREKIRAGSEPEAEQSTKENQ